MDTQPIFDPRSGKSARESLVSSVSFSELLEQFSGFLVRQYPIFVFVTVLTLAMALVYLFTTPAKYTAHAMLMIDSSKLRVLQQQQSAMADIPLDTAQVETQVEILKSETVALSVIRDQRLVQDPEFSASSGGIFGVLLGLGARFFDGGAPGVSSPSSESQLERRILISFLKQRTIARVGRTYVLDIGFTSLNPDRSATIANAIADAYIVDQLEAKYQATRRASSWLQDRIKELRTQATVADRAVLDYKVKNNIVDVGINPTIPNAGTRLLGEQQLAELNTQLGTARTATAEAKARYERIQDILKRDVPDAAVADSLRNEVITRLRNQYLDLSAREAIWAGRYGSNHLAAVSLRNQMQELRRSILDELGRIAESYKSDFEIAKARQEATEQNLTSLVAESQSTNRDRLGLRELESSAQVYHTIYDNFLQRYMEAIQQQSFPITESRVISAAAPPNFKSSPLVLLVLGIAAIIGVLLSAAVAVMREAVDRVFRTTRQIEDVLGGNCLAVLPIIGATSTLRKIHGETKAKSQRPIVLEEGVSERTSTIANLKHVDPQNSNLRQVVLEPLSQFAEAFRTIKVAMDIAGTIKENKVIGITSTIPQEGKSTVAANFAQSIAHAGKKIILVDGDLRNPTLTRGLAPKASEGILEVLAEKVDRRLAVYVDPMTGLEFLPVIIDRRLVHTNEILASVSFKRMIDELRAAYDYVIVDLPPVAPVVDVRATTHFIDSYVYVVEWGKTRMNSVQHQLSAAPEVYDRVLGFVLNKANLRILDRYEYHYGSSYRSKYYAKYGYVE